MALVCPIAMGGVAAGQVLAFKYPLPSPTPKLSSTHRAVMKGSSLVIIHEGVSCPFRPAASIRLPGSYSQQKQQCLCTRPAGLWPSCGVMLGRDRTGSLLWACASPPHSPFTVPSGTPDLLGLVLSATSFTNYTL